MQNKFIIPSWKSYQHYKDRNPPWIKLHYELLSSRAWVALDDASRVLAVACMLIASRNDGGIPDDDTYVQRVAYLNKRPNYKPLIDCGFIEYASTMLADASSLHTNARPETEAYSKEEKKEYTSAFLDFWKTYPRKDGSKSEAFKSYLKAKKETSHETIMAGLEKYVEASRGKDAQYIAHAATWLNGKRWEAEYTQEQRLTTNPHSRMPSVAGG